jgi:dipeptidyl aminopeptidase/acylaminoacyl peptidase
MGRVSLECGSSDGKWIIYGVKYIDIAKNAGDVNYFLLETATEKITPLLTNPEVSEENLRFRPDGKKIGYLKDNMMYEVNVDGTEENRVSSDKEKWNGFDYSPVGTHVLALKEVPYTQTLQQKYPDLPQAKARVYDDLMYRHWKNWEDGSYSNIFLYTYENGKITSDGKNIINGPYDSPLHPLSGMEEIAWTPKGKAIAYTCKKLSGKEYALSTNSDIYLYDLATDKTMNLSEENKGYDKQPFMNPNSGTVAWLSMQTPGFEADRNRILTFSLAKWGEKKELTLGFDNDAEDPVWASDKNIYFIGGDAGTKQIFKWDYTTEKITQLTKGVCDYSTLIYTPNGLITTRMSMSAPTELFKIDLKTGDAKQITFVNQAVLQNMKMGEVKKRIVKTTDNKDMAVWMIYPPDFNPSQQYPTLLYCQGGPQSVLSQFWSYRWNFQLMAANGYIVVAPCRRGMPTFGREWNDQISGDWGGQCMQDYLSAIDDAAKEPYVNKDKMGAVGASFGGYSVYWLAGNHNKRFKAFISHCGMFNVESWYGTTEELFFANYDIKGAYWDQNRPKTYDVFSPHKYVQNWDTPILVIHSEQDYRVPFSEGLQAYQAARLRGVPARLLTFSEEGHWVTGIQNSLVWQREFFAWLEMWLKK